MEKETQARDRGHASFFWPVILIGVGVIALLVNAGQLQVSNLWGLLNLWPLLLILAGIDLLFGRRLPALGGLLAVGLVGVVVWLLLSGSVPAWTGDRLIIGDLHIDTSPTEVKRDSYSAPRDGAQSLQVGLDLSSYPTMVSALPTGSANLFAASIDHAGPMRFEVNGEAQRQVWLGQQAGYVNVALYPSSDYRWDVQLAADLPLDMGVTVGSGSVNLDLAALDLTRLTLNGGSGDVEAALPSRDYVFSYQGGSGDLAVDVAPASQANVTLSTGSGNVQLVVGDEADLTLTLRDAGSGDVRLLAPRNMALQVQVSNAGSGDVQLPRDLVRQSGEDNEGLWQSANWGSGGPAIKVTAQNLGSGNLVISR